MLTDSQKTDAYKLTDSQKTDAYELMDSQKTHETNGSCVQADG